MLSQMARDLMREYVRARRGARDYGLFLEAKVEIARAQRRAGLGRSNHEIEAVFAARRTALLGGDPNHPPI